MATTVSRSVGVTVATGLPTFTIEEDDCKFIKEQITEILAKEPLVENRGSKKRSIRLDQCRPDHVVTILNEAIFDMLNCQMVIPPSNILIANLTGPGVNVEYKTSGANSLAIVCCIGYRDKFSVAGEKIYAVPKNAWAIMISSENQFLPKQLTIQSCRGKTFSYQTKENVGEAGAKPSTGVIGSKAERWIIAYEVNAENYVANQAEGENPDAIMEQFIQSFSSAVEGKKCSEIRMGEIKRISAKIKENVAKAKSSDNPQDQRNLIRENIAEAIETLIPGKGRRKSRKKIKKGIKSLLVGEKIEGMEEFNPAPNNAAEAVDFENGDLPTEEELNII